MGKYNIKEKKSVIIDSRDKLHNGGAAAGRGETGDRLRWED